MHSFLKLLFSNISHYWEENRGLKFSDNIKQPYLRICSLRVHPLRRVLARRGRRPGPGALAVPVVVGGDPLGHVLARVEGGRGRETTGGKVGPGLLPCATSLRRAPGRRRSSGAARLTRLCPLPGRLRSGRRLLLDSRDSSETATETKVEIHQLLLLELSAHRALIPESFSLHVKSEVPTCHDTSIQTKLINSPANYCIDK
jgi:hypothetical protein